MTPQQALLLNQPELLVIDLECTCGLGVAKERDVQEIIEIGWCRLAGGPGSQPTAGVSIYVRPTRTEVTPFCTALTGIAPDTVADQPCFAERMREFAALIERFRPTAWASWGEFDRTMFERQCVRECVGNPLTQLPHHNIKKLLASLIGEAAGWGEGTNHNRARQGADIPTALKGLGLAFAGREHSGADDAVNAARVIARVRELFPASRHRIAQP